MGFNMEPTVEELLAFQEENWILIEPQVEYEGEECLDNKDENSEPDESEKLTGWAGFCNKHGGTWYYEDTILAVLRKMYEENPQWRSAKK